MDEGTFFVGLRLGCLVRLASPRPGRVKDLYVNVRMAPVVLAQTTSVWLAWDDHLLAVLHFAAATVGVHVGDELASAPSRDGGGHFASATVVDGLGEDESEFVESGGEQRSHPCPVSDRAEISVDAHHIVRAHCLDELAEDLFSRADDHLLQP